MRDLTYPLYDPYEPPYVSLEQAHDIQTAYIESHWATSFHSTDILAPW